MSCDENYENEVHDVARIVHCCAAYYTNHCVENFRPTMKGESRAV